MLHCQSLPIWPSCPVEYVFIKLIQNDYYLFFEMCQQWFTNSIQQGEDFDIYPIRQKIHASI